jgi:mannitol 2-dehydrogenase
MSIRLSAQNLTQLPKTIARPNYRRGNLKPGIVHFGVGNFHRAHQAVYLDDLFNTGRDHDWAIMGAGVMPQDELARQRLKEQDFLTTVVEQDSGHLAARVTAVMTDYLGPGNGRSVITRLADPAIRVVSMTVTEGGYYIDPASGVFEPRHPDLRHDAEDLAQSKTVFGLILAGLKRRRESGISPFTVLSCDNLPHNGRVTMDAVAGLAELADRDLAQWVRENVAFPNSMVDRITPATTDRERLFLAERLGLEDNWPVFCEPFRQWVLEDNFPAGRPALEEAGVTFVKDVGPYELMKIRILNGGHAAIAYPAALMDIHFVHEAMEDPLIRPFLAKLEREEIIPVVPPVPGTDLADYFRLVEGRLSNPKIGDTVQRLCLDGSNRQPKFITPSIRDGLAAGSNVNGLALVSAFWCRYCFGTTDSGAVVAPNDPNWERLRKTALAAKEDPAAWLAMEDIYGKVTESSLFADAFAKNLKTLWKVGVRETLARFLSDAL